MKILKILSFLICVGIFQSESAKGESRINAVDYAQYVNQFLGTENSRWQIAPGPWMPMSMVKYSPDNQGSEWKGGYDYSIDNISGFSHVHDWTMAGLSLMPVTGPFITQPGPSNNPDLGYRSRIDKTTETSNVGIYEVDLLDYNIHAELSATCRATMSRFTYSDGKTPRLLIDLHIPAEYTWDLIDAQVTKMNDYELEGWALSDCSTTGYGGDNRYTLHFVMQFDHKIEKMDGWVMDRIQENIEQLDKKVYEPNWYNSLSPDFQMRDAGVRVSFSDNAKKIKVRVGISYVSIDQARLNLSEEIIKPFGWNFEDVVQNQKNVWNNLLSRVEIETSEEEQLVKFYSNLYRALAGRSTWSDVNGKYVDMYEKEQQAAPGKTIYANDCYWGTHWNLNTFFNLIYPEITSNIVYTFSEMYDKGGYLPTGNPGFEYFRVMPGQTSIPLIVAAYQAGIRDFDAEKMFEAMYKSQTSPMIHHPAGGEVGNEGYPFYLKYGYTPCTDKSTWYHQEWVSNSMEFPFQDWCFAQYCKAFGGHNDLYREFMKRSENWRKCFDAEIGFVRPRYPDGKWMENFDPYHAPGFCESNSWQYSFYVPQNMPGLIEAMGKERFIERLEYAFEESSKANFNASGDAFALYSINHGNQSNMQASHLFNHAGKSWLTQKWTRAIQNQYYGMTPETAYPGDEDQGQMSAWFVMSSIGLFQMDGGCSVEPYYEFSCPRYNKVTIHLSEKYRGGGTITILSRNASNENMYIQSVKVNGKRIDDFKFPQKEIINGGKIVFDMGPIPKK